MLSPAWISPCLPTLVRQPPSGPDWLHEIKHDGYRCLCVVDRGAVRVFTRRGHDWTARFGGIVPALQRLKLRTAAIDGEAVIPDENGISDFFALHSALARRSAPNAVLMAFDLVHLNGEDLRGRMLEERRSRLAGAIGATSPWLRMSEAIEEDGERVLQAAGRMGLEGIVSKRRDSRYSSGRSKSWRKAKRTLVDHFGVLGIDRRRASLRLARLVAGELVPCGHVGAGLTTPVMRRIAAAIDTRQAVVALVEYRGLTPAGELRHPALKRWQSG